MVTLFVGQKLQSFTSLPSTNEYIKQNVRKSWLPDGYVVQTQHQTEGRGQFGNTWQDEPGQNLLFSVLLKPNFLQASQQFKLNMSVCLALVQALNKYKLGFEVKWPNDILFKGKKVCGILIENSLKGDAIEHAIVGVGLNVNQQTFATLPNATSLALLLQKEIPIPLVFEQVLKEIEATYLQLKSGANALKQRYLSVLYGFKKQVPIVIGNEHKLLTIQDVNNEGQLVGEVHNTLKKFNFKELEFQL